MRLATCLMTVMSLAPPFWTFSKFSLNFAASALSGFGVMVCARGVPYIRNSAPLGPYSRNIPRALWWSLERAVSYERGTHAARFRAEREPLERFLRIFT